MQDVYLFVKKDYYFNLVSTENGENMYNLPQYNTNITLWKGINNPIRFSIRDRDRKGYTLGNKQIIINIINQKLNYKFTKSLECFDEYKGLYDLIITDSELRDFEETYYQGSIVAIDEEGKEELLYSGTEWNPIFTIYVKEGLRDVFKPSITLNPSEFLYNYYTNNRDGHRYDYYTSSNIKADETDSHTASITVKNNFIGKIIMEASVEVSPEDNEENWFVIEEKEYDNKTSVEEETFMFNKQLNCLWIRFKYETKYDNQGEIAEIVYRN